MKDRILGLLTTLLLFGLPGMVFAAGEFSWARSRILEHPGWTWVVAIALLLAVGILFGIEKRGCWDGILIDSTNRKSLSRLQALVWGTILLSGIVAAITINMARDCRVPEADSSPASGSCVESPVDLHIPEQVLVLAGLSAATLGFAIAANSSNGARTLSRKATSAAIAAGLISVQKDDEGAVVATRSSPPNQFFGVIAGKDSIEHSSFSDLVKGDVAQQGAYIDLARTQQLVLTLVLAGIYSVFFLQEIRLQAGAVQFPEFDAGLNILLAISGITYLGAKTVLGISASGE